MTATLTIKAEANGVIETLDRIRTTIEASVKASEKLQANATAVATQFGIAAKSVNNLRADLSALVTETRAAAQHGTQFRDAMMVARGVSAAMSRDFEKMRAEAMNAARAINSMKAPSLSAGFGTTTGPGSGGFSFTPVPRVTPTPSVTPGSALPRHGGHSVPSRVGFGSAFGSSFGLAGGGPGQSVSNAFSALGSVGSGLSGGFGSAAGTTGGLLAGGLTRGAGAAITGIAGVAQRTFSAAFSASWEAFKTAGMAAVGVVGGLLANSIRLAIKQEPIEGAFGNLVSANGIGEQVAVLNDLRAAAKGTVSDLQLMTNANAAMQLGAARTTEEMELLIEGGRRLGKAMGRDATEGFNDLALGIGRQSKLILDNLGIIIKADDVYSDYAKKVGVSTDDLSENEKKLVFQAAAFESVRDKMKALGVEQETASDKINRLQASFTNLSVEVGQQFAPMIGDVADKWAAFLDSLSGDDVANALNKTVDAFGSMFDRIFPDDIAESVGNLGTDVWQAFVDPSKEAFEIVKIRFEQLMNIIGAKFEKLTTTAWEGLGSSLDQVLYFTRDKLGLVQNEYSVKELEKATEAIEAPEKEAKRANKLLEKEIDKLRQQIKNKPEPERRAGSLGFVASGGTSAGTGGSSSGSTATSSDVLLKEARAAAVEEKAAAEAKKKAQEEHNRTLREEVKYRQKLLDFVKDEIEAKKDTIDDLRGARSNASAALGGLADPRTTLVQQLDAIAGEIREMPDVFAEIKEKLRENGVELADTVKQFNTTIASTFKDFERGLAKQAQSFLQEGPQDGETVRVRSIKRRAQRDLRRLNTGLVNDAFRSPEFGGFDKGGSGFGALGVERSGSVLNQKFPQLENALALTRAADGTTQLVALQERVTEIVTAHAEQLATARDAQAALLDQQAAAHEKQEELQERTNELLDKAIAEEERHTTRLGVLEKQLAIFERQLEKAIRLAR